MKQIAFYLASFFITSSMFSQTYQIDFESSTINDTLDNILIINLSSNDTLQLESNIQLILTDNVSGIENEISELNELNIYPNPGYGELVIEQNMLFRQPAFISIADLSGRLVYSEQLKPTDYDKINISNIPNGIYVLSIGSSYNQYSELIISQSNINSWSGLITNYHSDTKSSASNLIRKSNLKRKSSMNIEATMLYNEGERILLVGHAGNKQTVVVFIPTKDTTISFNFYQCTDGDNNYKIVEIANQIWMAENLRTTKYNNGTAIPKVTDAVAWADLSSPGYCWYDNDSSINCDTYGALYNWCTVETGDLCPISWHVPDSAELVTLFDNLGGTSEAGGKLKENGTTHWANPNYGATDETGFTALPGGYRSTSGAFSAISGVGGWWSATEYETDRGWSWGMNSNSNGVYSNDYNEKVGYSVRCVKD